MYSQKKREQKQIINITLIVLICILTAMCTGCGGAAEPEIILPC